MARLHADHVRIFVVAKVGHLPRLVQPRIPNDRVRKVILLQTHLPARDHIRDDVLLRSVLVDSIGPLVDRNYISALLINRPLPSLVNKRAAVKSSDLTPPYVWNLQVRVQQQVEGERDVLTGIVDADVEVQLFLAENQSIRYSKAGMKTTAVKKRSTNYQLINSLTDSSILTEKSHCPSVGTQPPHLRSAAFPVPFPPPIALTAQIRVVAQTTIDRIVLQEKDEINLVLRVQINLTYEIQREFRRESVSFHRTRPIYWKEKKREEH